MTGCSNPASTGFRRRNSDSTSETVQRRDQLAMVGYVWKPPGAGDRRQPGIPSLMRYLRSPAAAGAATDA